MNFQAEPLTTKRRLHMNRYSTPTLRFKQLSIGAPLQLHPKHSSSPCSSDLRIPAFIGHSRLEQYTAQRARRPLNQLLVLASDKRSAVISL